MNIRGLKIFAMNLVLRLTFIFMALAGILGLWSCKGNRFTQGEMLYNSLCVNCHMEDGKGLRGLIPPLAGADFVRDQVGATACVIRYGLPDTVVVNGQVYRQPMAGFPALTEFEIANIVNFIRSAWGNDYGYVPLGQIKNGLEKCDPAE